MNSIYNCPHCGKKSFNPWKKAFAGQLNSPGKVCAECGQKVVNGKGATIFNAVYCILSFILVVLIYLFDERFIGTEYEWIRYNENLISPIIILLMFIVPKIVNAFCFRLAPAIRIEPVK